MLGPEEPGGNGIPTLKVRCTSIITPQKNYFPGACAKSKEEEETDVCGEAGEAGEAPPVG